MTQTSQTRTADSYDVVVVGGGTAGLSGAMALGRSRRSVLVLDAGAPRNATAGHVHNYLGREGTPPSRLLRIGRDEVAAYGVQVADDAVRSIRTWDRPGTGFTVTTDGNEVLARRLLVATGVSDDLPDVPGLAERWGRDVLHCPYCHGWEVRDTSVVVLARNAMATHQAMLFRQLTDHVVLVVGDGVPMPAAEDLERLAARDVRLVQDTPVEVLVEDDRLCGVRLARGELLSCEAVVVSPYFRARAEFLAPLGLEPQPFVLGEQQLGAVLAAEPTGATAVPGVWVAGNVTDPMAQVVGSAAAGLRAGAMVNADLVTEDFDTAVVAHRAELADRFEQGPWEERYAARASVWSGNVNPQLAVEADGLEPGRALDIGSGEGADAIWLARNGWSVTGVDFSRVALARAAEHAAEVGVGERIEWRHDDVRAFGSGDSPADAPGAEQWDLVTSSYMHLPDGGMVDLTRRLAAAVAPGGTLLVVGHHPDDLETGLRHGRHSYMFRPEDLVPALDPDEWSVEVVETRPRTVQHEGKPVAVSDSVLRARRRE